ncbi:MAG: tRNA pseudouridine(55) synthase TruB [Coriobacteriia bacterium]
MASRRGATPLEGVLVIDKPGGLTSHDVVAAVRRATGEGRVGHAGTLDPAATGVLIILVGPYTRLEPYLSSATKSYEAAIVFGSATDTDDADGTQVAHSDVPADVDDADRARRILASLIGMQLQRPPEYSAIKRGGVVAHRAARAGAPIWIEPRRVEIIDAQLARVDAEAHTWFVTLTVSKGTYIRSIARDLGETLGTHAHLGSLRRTASGGIDIASAIPLDDAVAAGVAGTLADRFADPFAALGLPVIHAQAQVIADGKALRNDGGYAEDSLVAIDVGGRLAAVYRASGDCFVADAVFPGIRS